MPAPITFGVSAAILAHHQHGMSSHKIIRASLGMAMTAYKTTFLCGIRESKLKSLGVSMPLKTMATQYFPIKFINNLIKEVDDATDKADPPSQE
jgi:hypothetical protein